MIFGPLLGGMADKHGRKRMSIFFCAIYSVSCFTQTFENFYILMIGRILSGIATSLLVRTQFITKECVIGRISLFLYTMVNENIVCKFAGYYI